MISKKPEFPKDSINTVLCTHLHVDHVGWNTTLVGDRWAPTFTKARYLVGRKEWAHWSVQEDKFTRDPNRRLGAAGRRRGSR